MLWTGRRSRSLVVGIVVAASVATAAITARRADAARPVLLLGDSVMASATPALSAQGAAHGWSPTISARAGRTTQDGAAVVASLRGAIPNDVVVELGNNDARDPATYRARIDAVMQQLQRAHRVVWLTMTPSASWVPAANAELVAATRRWPSLHVADWGAASRAVRGGLLGPGPHLTVAGQRAFAAFVFGALTTTSRVTTFGFRPRRSATRSTAVPFTPVGFAAHRGVARWVVSSEGAVATLTGARSFGGLPAGAVRQPIVGMAATPTGRGYWLVASDGGVFAFGDARFYGSAGDQRLMEPIVGMAATPAGRGYWLVASDGGVFAFGDARFFGSAGGLRLEQPIVGMAATPAGRGYWLVASDGGVFTFGDARFFGSTGAIRLDAPIVGMAATHAARGYWLVASDGGVFAFGDAPFVGSAAGRGGRALGMIATTDGYTVVAAS